VTPSTPSRRLPLLFGFIVDNFNRTFLLFACLAGLGLLAGIWRFVNGLGMASNMSDGYPWGIWIGFDFSLIAISGAGFTMATVVYILGLERFRPALRPAVLAGFLGYCAVLVLLILDLGRPDRFYHFLLYWNLHSPLFEISWCVLLYTAVLTFEVSPTLFDAINKHSSSRFVHGIILPLSVLALTLSSLHQSTLGTLYLNMPYKLDALWYTPILPLLFFVSSVATGLSVAILAYLLACKLTGKAVQPEVRTGLSKGVAGALVLYLVLKVVDLVAGGDLPALVGFQGKSPLMWVELLGGTLAPLVVLLLPGTRVRMSWQSAASAAVVLGMVLNRFNATLFGQQTLPGAQYVPHLAEWMTTIGVLSGAGLIWFLAVKYLAVFEGESHQA
jgi:Ni/Fe-hydrogenase subunit HybB-like protein